VRSALVTALLACSDSSVKIKARRFLQGLSSDELQFIAEYLGACILESTGPCQSCPGQPTAVVCYRPKTADEDHKMILLLEYLRRSRLAGQASAYASGA
jgi:hypothetical protein